jgi:hypothetical protein
LAWFLKNEIFIVFDICRISENEKTRIGCFKAIGFRSFSRNNCFVVFSSGALEIINILSQSGSTMLASKKDFQGNGKDRDIVHYYVDPEKKN